MRLRAHEDRTDLGHAFTGDGTWAVDRAFAGVGLILHAGDIYTSECLDALERIAPVLAVEVPPTPADGDPRIEYRRLIELDGYQVGLVHDLNIRGIDEFMPGLAAAKYPTEGSLAGALEAFFGGPVDVAVFGHTHFAMVETHQGVLLVNPGSPTLPRQTKRLGSVGVLELTPAGVSAQIVELATLRDS